MSSMFSQREGHNQSTLGGTAGLGLLKGEDSMMNLSLSLSKLQCFDRVKATMTQKPRSLHKQ